MTSIDESRLEAKYPADSRYEETEKILSYIKTGNSCQVISLPGVGRSNILRLIAYNSACRKLHLKEKAEDFHFVLTGFAEVKGKPTSEAYKHIFLEILESLSARKLDGEYREVKQIFDSAVSGGDEMVIFNGLKKTVDYLCIEKDMNLILLFDRFEDYVPILEPAFFDNLRVLRDRAKYKFSAVLPISRPIEEIVGNEMLSSFYEFIVGNVVYLSLGDEKIMRFRKELLEKNTGKKIDEKTNQKVLDFTGGLGKLWLVCTQIVLEGKSMDYFQESSRVKAVLTEIWESLTPYEQSLIRDGKALESPHLVAVGLIKNNKFAVPLLESFAKQQAPENKIDLAEVSDDLTSSEFKLLKFLMDNPSEVLSRDDVVQSVWGDLASTSGVTEQALDQLIFRLRRKIEDNPNSPEHIQTVKGRGFKFTP